MKRRILVVEDDEFIRDVIAASLEGEGYVIDGAACAAELWERLAVVVPDLILLDLALPEEDGLSICRKLRSRPKTAHLPIVFVSAMGQPMYVQAAYHAGGNAFIRKPFEIDHLIATVAHFVRSPVETVASGEVAVAPVTRALSVWESSMSLCDDRRLDGDSSRASCQRAADPD